MKICAISDLHGMLPPTEKIPEDCQLLLIAGDICPDFGGRSSSAEKQYQWWQDKFLPWASKDHMGNIDIYGTWGNHDWLANPNREWAKLDDCRAFIRVDELVEYPYEGGMLKIWFSPWSNMFGNWAWMDDPETLETKYAAIPEGVNIIVSHQPPRGFCDTAGPPINEPNLGSKELRNRMFDLRPEAIICGHIHGGYGWKRYDRTTVYNVALVDEMYRPINPVTIIDWS